MKNVLLYLWQIPQNLVGLLVIAFTKAIKVDRVIDGKTYIYWLTHKWNFGVSLGKYIIVGDTGEYMRKAEDWDNTIKHESGHQTQSKRWGVLYLFTVGIVSASRNIFDRIFHKNTPYIWRVRWYYGSWPEKQADKYGEVRR